MIEFEGIRKRFGAVDVLKGIDLSVPRGRVLAVVGPNGSGKTTLIRMLVGLVRPDEGRIKWDGKTLNGDHTYRERLGYMPQIVRFPGNLSGRELQALLSSMRATCEPDLELARLFGLGREMDVPFRALSGGTRQKINAVLAFLFRPELLILDEPTSGLDPLSARALKAKIRKERDAGRTFILTSHIMSEVETLADDVALLLDGRIRYAGPVLELKSRTGESELEGAIARMMTRPVAA